MIFIPGNLIAFLTFPGVIIHELAHQIFCWIMRVPVYEVKYFRLGNPCGYVVHEPVRRPLASFLISTGPFLFNTLLGVLFLMPVSIGLVKFDALANTSWLGLMGGAPKIVVIWLGLSILMHAFPSKGDAQVVVATVLKNPEVSLLGKVLAAPAVGLMYLGAIGSVVWLDLVYAIFAAAMLPNILQLFL